MALVLLAAVPVGVILYLLRQIIAEIIRHRGLPRRGQVGHCPAHVRGQEILDTRHQFSVASFFVSGLTHLGPFGQRAVPASGSEATSG